MELNPLQADGSLDYDGLTTLMKYLLDAAWGENWGTFTADAPSGNDPANIKFPIITYSLKSMVPGKVGKETREIRPRQRFLDRKEAPNGNEPPATKIMGQVFDAVIVFEVWEESNAKVEKLARNFRNFMNIYSGYFQQQGLRRLMFTTMDDQKESTKIIDNCQSRRLVYQVQFEELTEMPSDIIRVIEQVNQLIFEIRNKQP